MCMVIKYTDRQVYMYSEQWRKLTKSNEQNLIGIGLEKNDVVNMIIDEQKQKKSDQSVAWNGSRTEKVRSRIERCKESV